MKNKPKKQKCHQCAGSGKIWKGRHWYSVGYQVECSYCHGKGILDWEV